MSARCRSLLAVFFALLLLPSCAAIFDGTNDVIAFTSEPGGAKVVVGKDVVGVTPCSANVSKKLRKVTFRCDGFPEREVPIEASFGFGWFLMDLLFTPGFGMVGFLIDGASSAWMDPQAVVHCDFTKPAPAAPAAKALDSSRAPDS